MYTFFLFFDIIYINLRLTTIALCYKILVNVGSSHETRTLRRQFFSGLSNQENKENDSMSANRSESKDISLQASFEVLCMLFSPQYITLKDKDTVKKKAKRRKMKLIIMCL